MIDSTPSVAPQATDTNEIRLSNGCPPWCTAGHLARLEAPEHVCIVDEGNGWHVALSRWSDADSTQVQVAPGSGLECLEVADARSLAVAITRAADLAGLRS